MVAADSMVSIVGGVGVFSIVGYLAEVTGKEVDELLTDGEGKFINQLDCTMVNLNLFRINPGLCGLSRGHGVDADGLAVGTGLFPSIVSTWDLNATRYLVQKFLVNRFVSGLVSVLCTGIADSYHMIMGLPAKLVVTPAICFITFLLNITMCFGVRCMRPLLLSYFTNFSRVNTGWILLMHMVPALQFRFALQSNSS